MYRVLPLVLVAMALALFVAAPVMGADNPAKAPAADNAHQANWHEGTVVSVTGDKLIMKGRRGNEHTHTLAADAKVTCDGKACKLSDLKAGERVRVQTMASDKNMATRVDALDKNAHFEKSSGSGSGTGGGTSGSPSKGTGSSTATPPSGK